MKHLLFLFFIVSGLAVSGQVTVTIKPADTTLCYGDSIAYVAEVSGSGAATVFYQWQKNFIDIPGAADSLYIIPAVKNGSPGLYRCIVTAGGLSGTSNDAQLRMHPRMYIDTLYRYNSLGCPQDCKGQFKVLVSGGTRFKNYPPYIYEWGGGFSQDTIVFGLCRANYTLKVTDSLNCSIDTGYFVDALRSPKVDFEFLPRDTIYLTNPNIQVIFPDTALPYMANWTFDFGDSTIIPNLNPSFHTYERTGTFPVRLKFTDMNGCDTIITHDLVVKVAKLKITNLLTPNGDGFNDAFKIHLEDVGESQTQDFSEAYLSNEFIVFDRWGKKVYEKKNFRSKDWDGANLADGTYFYILKCHGQFGDEVFKGSVTLLREKL